ncbi:MAG: 2-C-methyl-D-erythritol 4-phosphate cytidylyltransferase [Bacteroidetes bacterium]|nr:2-C-methyl-D-erythritol 4-phosphate cytidylyltransferase [Bacteroidota bacterium]MBL7103668.1 2-C-methyl-D-erythritol 4-phosphate cytidylyltransferase [Bacteroidales bacterium]
MKKKVIIVAGGQGKRMNTEIPKQFLNVARKPILMHTIEKFYSYADKIKIILVIPEPYFKFWRSLCNKFDFKIEHKLVAGGETRFNSVKNGLQEIYEPCVVAIHDGVRPLVSHETLSRVFSLAEENGNAIPVGKIYESMRQLETDNSFPVNREQFRMIQTPQCFHSDLIKKAYKQKYRKVFTDDATVVEAMGVKINLVEGNIENIKITRPVDLKFAEALLK